VIYSAIHVVIESSWTSYILPIVSAAISAALAVFTFYYVRITRRLATESTKARLSSQTPQVTVVVKECGSSVRYRTGDELNARVLLGSSDLVNVNVELKVVIGATNHGPGPATISAPDGWGGWRVVVHEGTVRIPWAREWVLAEGDDRSFEYIWHGNGDEFRSMVKGPPIELEFVSGNRVSEVIDRHRLVVRLNGYTESADGARLSSSLLTVDTLVARSVRTFPFKSGLS
jgi:hypothetical protein